MEVPNGGANGDWMSNTWDAQGKAPTSSQPKEGTGSAQWIKKRVPTETGIIDTGHRTNRNPIINQKGKRSR